MRFVTLLGWGTGALATSLVLIAAVRYVRRNSLSGLDEADPELAPATVFDAARGLTIGGFVLASLSLSHLWMESVPGPYAESPELLAAAWLVAIALLALMMVSATATAAEKVPAWPTWCAFALLAALPLVWAVPVRVAQEPPISPQEVNAHAQIRLVRLDRLPQAEVELGLKTDHQGASGGDPRLMPTELLGRVDVARPAPAGTDFQLFAFDRRTNNAVHIYGADGAGWHGRWTEVLAARYPWLSHVVGVRDARGFPNDLLAVSPDPESGLFWFQSPIADPGTYSADDLQLVLMLVRDEDGYVYWAAPVPSTTSKAFT